MSDPLAQQIDEVDSKFRNLCLNDATVYNWMKMAEVTGTDEVTSLKLLVLELAREKKYYLDECTRITPRVLSGPIVAQQKGTS